MRNRLARRWWVSLALGVAACGAFDPLGGGGNASTGAQGFGAPTVEVTVAGQHFGPAAPDGSSFAQLATTTDPTTGAVTSSTFTATASSTAAGASCAIAATRQGQDVAPFTVAGYQLAPFAGGDTPDGTAWPQPSESVFAQGSQWVCSGNDCNGAALVLTALDATHVEGYLQGTFPSATGGDAADVVCAFYLPVRN